MPRLFRFCELRLSRWLDKNKFKRIRDLTFIRNTTSSQLIPREFPRFNIKVNRHPKPERSRVAVQIRKRSNQQQHYGRDDSPHVKAKQHPVRNSHHAGKSNGQHITRVHRTEVKTGFGKIGLAAVRTALRHLRDAVQVVRTFHNE